jgi:hypothetical protein
MKLLYFFPFIFCTKVFSQSISGKVENINGMKIMLANVVTKDSINAISIKEFVVARNGVYSISLSKQYKQLVLEVSANKYQKEVFVIDSFIASKNYTHNFILVKDTVVKLQDVVVTAKVRPFQIKGDTVKYNVSAYRDGTERKIQDVIKKLPGIEVNESTGEIKYKGKSVETVKLDGEDLFASNYTIGTKNINVDMVEQVQAIENYSDNPLLKGIESGDKVALNLTLKKKKADFSGSLDLGLGIVGSELAIDASTDVLGISKKYKSFATVSYNNVGINNTPFDYFAYNPNIEQLREAEFLAKKYIPDTYFNTDIDSKRSNINNSFFSSYNAVFKIGKKINLKSNLYYLNDKLTSEQLNVSINNINGQQLITSDNYSIVKKPVQLRGDVEIKYNISTKSLLEYSLQLREENIETNNEVLQNSNANFNTSFTSNDVYFKQNLILTTKLSDKKALQFVGKYTANNLPQLLSFKPAVIEPNLYSLNNQKSKFNKSCIVLQSNLLGSTTKGKYQMTIGTNLKDIDFNSDLIGTNGSSSLSISGFQNQTTYKQNSIFINGNYKLILKRFRITPSLALSSVNQRLLNYYSNPLRDTNNFLIEPNLSIVYKINDFSGLLISAGFKQKPFAEDYLIENSVLISNRIIKSNDISLKIQQSKNLGVFYIINNLYKQFQLNIGANYSENNGNYFSNLLIQQNSTKSIYFFFPEKNRIFSLNFLIEKYIPFLQGTVRLKNDYSAQFYKNIVNNSTLRNNTLSNFNTSLFFKTAFDWKINFENTFTHRLLESKTESGLQLNNQFIANNFQIIIKPKKRFFILLATDFYLPSTQTPKQKYFFLDTDVTYQTKNKIYDFRLKARNITNNKTLNQFDINDFSTTNFQTNLLPRHFVLSVSRNF